MELKFIHRNLGIYVCKKFCDVFPKMGNIIAAIKDKKKVILGKNHLMLLDPNTKGKAHIIPSQPALDPVRIINIKIASKIRNEKILFIKFFLILIKYAIANGQIILSQEAV